MWSIKEIKTNGKTCIVNFYFNGVLQYSILMYDNGRSVINDPTGRHIEKLPEYRKK